MVRPCASQEIRLLCLQFAQSCTKQTNNPSDLLARCGPLSPFAVLSKCCPTAVRVNGVGRRDAITELECNKVLQNGGFQMIRDRRTSAKNKNEDPYGSGLYIYIEVQWCDPDNSEDLSQLLRSWNTLRANYEIFAQECSFDKFLSVIRETLHAWKPKNTRKDIRARTNNLKRPLERQDSTVTTGFNPVDRQGSQTSMASTVVDIDFDESNGGRNRACSWAHEDFETHSPAKRQCLNFPPRHSLPTATALHAASQATPYSFAAQETVFQDQLEHRAPPVRYAAVQVTPPCKARVPTAGVQGGFQLPDLFDATVGQRLPDHEKLDDQVVLSLLRRPVLPASWSL